MSCGQVYLSHSQKGVIQDLGSKFFEWGDVKAYTNGYSKGC